jgi:hypothetical protein
LGWLYIIKLHITKFSSKNKKIVGVNNLNVLSAHRWHAHYILCTVIC